MMAQQNAQSKGLVFHNLTLSEATSERNNLRWVTEVVQREPCKGVQVRRTQESENPGKNEGASEVQRNKIAMCKGDAAKLSFINVSGAPTKESRREARKTTTNKRRVEKKKSLEVERKAGFLALITGSSSAEGSGSSSTTETPLQDFSIFSLAHISRFAASRLDPFMIYPFELTHREKRLLDHIFYVESEAVKPYKEVIFPLGLTDVAAFHQVLANIAVQLEFHRLPGQETEKAIDYEKCEVETRHNAALQITRKRLMNPQEAISDGTIATIITMICYSHLTKDFTAWHSHIKGLREILKLQNQLRKPDESTTVEFGFLGLDTLLRRSLAWVDVIGSGTQDLRPYFPFIPRENKTDPIKKSPTQTKAILITDELIRAFPSGKEIFCMFLDVAILTGELNAQLSTRSKKVYEDGAWGWGHLYPLMHKLYSYREDLDIDIVESVLKECCRLALCIFLTHIRAKFGSSPYAIEVYVEQLLPLVQNVGFMTDYGKEQSSFRLWVLVMGTMESRGEMRAAFVTLLKRELRVLDIATHVDLEEALMDIMWIGEIEGERFWKLYGEVWIVEGAPTSISSPEGA